MAKMPRHYLRNGKYRVAGAMRKIRKDLPEPNRTYALDWGRFLELNSRKDLTIARRLEELRWLLSRLGQNDAKLARREDIEQLVIQINRSEKADMTKRKLKQALKAFFRWLYHTDIFPEIVRWVKPGGAKVTKLPEQMLSEEDVRKLITACRNSRDRALIALMWDTGARIGEILNLKVRNLVLRKDNLSHIMVDGKTGQRRIPIIFSVPYLGNYLNDARRLAKPEDCLFVVIDHGGLTERPLDYPHIRKMLGDLKVRAKIEKRVFAHLFRHSRASFLANSLTEPQLRAFFGWANDSKMVGTYVHMSGRDIDNAVLAANGLENEIETKKPMPSVIDCPKCNEKNPSTTLYCWRCGCPINAKVLVDELDGLKEAKKLAVDWEDTFRYIYNQLDAKSQAKIMKVINGGVKKEDEQKDQNNNVQ